MASTNEETVGRMIEVNGRRYRLAVAADSRGVRRRLSSIISRRRSRPALRRSSARCSKGGAAFESDCVIPSFTNPNNLSIVCGVPPSGAWHLRQLLLGPGRERWCGRRSDENDPALSARRHVAGCRERSRRGGRRRHRERQVAPLAGLAVERHLLFGGKSGHGDARENGIDEVLGLVGLPLPDVYSAALSEFVFAAGVRLAQTRTLDLMYLSTTDYIQHKFAPGTEGANAFYAMMDGYLAQLDALGWVIGRTADHGMNAKHDPQSGEPNVIYLQDVLDEWLGARKARVILPITDPYVVHHGALGSFATIYLPRDVSAAQVIERIRGLAEVELVLDNRAACERFELPNDRVGDIVVIGTKHVVLGTRRDEHDLFRIDRAVALAWRLVGTGSAAAFQSARRGIADRGQWGGGRRLRNFDIFDVALNRVSAS